MCIFFSYLCFWLVAELFKLVGWEFFLKMWTMKQCGVTFLGHRVVSYTCHTVTREYRRRNRIADLLISLYLPRDGMHSADYAVTTCLSVRLSVCSPSHTSVLSKRFNISSNVLGRAPVPSSLYQM